MRHVYLVRHAMPDIPLGERWCVGRTDLPLGIVGKLQAALLAFVPELQNRPVYCSHLTRAKETARPIDPDPIVREGLEEQDMGEWDGLSFTQIRTQYPELYEAREGNAGLMPPGSEPIESVRSRMRKAVLSILDNCDRDPVIVSHKSAIASLTGRREELLYTSISILNEKLQPVEVGRVDHPVLTEKVCLALLKAAETPIPVIEHSLAVAQEALRLAEELPVDQKRLVSAALLHDIARTQPSHAETGASWIRALGYPEVAEIISQHHDPEAPVLNQAGILYLADKYWQGDRKVTLAERFAQSGEKCQTAEARAAHERRFALARQLEEKLAGGE